MDDNAVNPSTLLGLRQRAEAALQARAANPAALSAEETAQLLHELQVHQIELEMQNEELRRAQLATQEAHDRYAELYDFTPVAYFTLNGKGRIVQSNLTGADLLGVERRALLERPLSQRVAREDQDAFYHHHRKLLETGAPQVDEIQLVRPDGSQFYARLDSVLAEQDGRIEQWRAVVSDITERKQVEEKLEYLSTHDALTGLHNRAYFQAEMARLERSRQFPVSVVMTDVDGLKTTNDRQGHAAGDDLLRRTAQVLKSTFRGEDVVARIGGDEFAALLPNTGATAVAEALARLKNNLVAHNRAHATAPVLLSLGAATVEKRQTPQRCAKTGGCANVCGQVA